MKRLLAFIIAVTLFFSFSVPALAVEDVPVGVSQVSVRAFSLGDTDISTFSLSPVSSPFRSLFVYPVGGPSFSISPDSEGFFVVPEGQYAQFDFYCGANNVRSAKGANLLMASLAYEESPSVSLFCSDIRFLFRPFWLSSGFGTVVYSNVTTPVSAAPVVSGGLSFMSDGLSAFYGIRFYADSNKPFPGGKYSIRLERTEYDDIFVPDNIDTPFSPGKYNDFIDYWQAARAAFAQAVSGETAFEKAIRLYLYSTANAMMNFPDMAGYIGQSVADALNASLGRSFNQIYCGLVDSVSFAVDNIVGAIWGTADKTEKDFDDSYNPAVDQGISEAQSNITAAEGFEQGIFDQADSAMSQISPGGVQTPSTLINSMAFISGLWTDSYNQLPSDFQFVITFPLFLGIALMFIGRSGRVFGGMMSTRSKSSGNYVNGQRVTVIDAKYFH